MTIFGVDFHPTFQSTLDMADLKQAGMTFALCKVTEGSGWFRDGYHRFSAAAKAQGLLFCAYHFLRSESSGQAQAAWTKACMGPDWGTVPVMLDWETSVSNTDAGASTAAAYVAAVAGLGGRVTLNYCPRWFWSRIGSPNLAAAGLSSMALIQSSYVAGTGTAAVLYPGDTSSRWNGFGGKTVSILQFSSNCRVPGYGGPLDINAYRGTRADLAATGWFHDPDPALNEEADVNLGDRSKLLPELLPHYLAAGAKVSASTEQSVERWIQDGVLRGYEARSEAKAARVAAEAARDAATSGGVVIDYDKLAAAIVSRLPAGVTPPSPQDIAKAVADEQYRRQEG